VRYQLAVEAALVEVLARRGICAAQVAQEVRKACREVTPEEVQKEEEKTNHNIRALVNCIQARVSEEARPFVHFTATSFDITDTASALRYKDVTEKVILPGLMNLEKLFISLARREKDTLQIGRTHGQHAVPITFGFAMAEYVDRLGGRIEKIREAAADLRGKMAGAVGAYNASSLFFTDPSDFELEVLAELGLKPSPYSTQIVEPEFMTDYLHALISCFGVLANLADDMRNLQRSEIAEVGEFFGATQVGSSTMPHKRNPWNFEHVKSMWKEFMPRMATIYMDQISEHQRDLTNSASARFIPEIVAGLALTVDRLARVIARLAVDKEAMEANFAGSREMIVAEPLYILLAYYGHPDAHEIVRVLTLEAQKTGRPLRHLVTEREDLKPYLARMTSEQRRVLDEPELYRGRAAEKTEELCRKWEERLSLDTGS
ncbi:MAG: lyase family protein, partial [Syntrophothermus sp.]